MQLRKNRFTQVTFFVTILSLGYISFSAGMGAGGQGYSGANISPIELMRISELLYTLNDRLNKMENNLTDFQQAVKDDPAAREKLKNLQNQFTFGNKMKTIFKEGIESGARTAVQSTVSSLLAYPFRGLQYNNPTSSGISGVFRVYLYRLIFGRMGVTFDRLVDINRDIMRTYSTYFDKSASSRVKERRAQNLGELDETGKAVNEDWLEDQKELADKLTLVAQSLRESLELYNGSYLKESYFSTKFYLGKLISALAPYDLQRLCDHLNWAIYHVEKLIELVKSANSIAEFEQNSAKVNKRLNMIYQSLYSAAEIIDRDTTLRFASRFVRPNAQGGSQPGGMSQLADLLGNGSSLQL